MNCFGQILATSALVAMFCGCQTSAPKLAAPAFKTRTGQQQASFLAVSPTNQVPLEWRQAPTNFFRLGPGDAVDIEMLNEPGSQSTAIVGPDGKIYFSLLPGIF